MILNVNKFLEKRYEKFLLILLCIWISAPFITLLLSRKEVYLKNIIWYNIFSIIGLCLVIFSILKVMKEKDYKKFIPILLFLIWTSVCTFKASDFSFALYGNSYRQEGLIAYFLYSGYFISSFYMMKKESIFRFMKWFSLSAFLLCIFQHILGPIENASVFYQFNHFGYYLMFSVIISIFNFVLEKKKYKKIIYLLLYVYLLSELIINNTFGCYLSILITLILFFIYSIFVKKNLKEILIVFVSFVILSFLIKNDMGHSIVLENLNVFKKDVVAVVSMEDEETINKAGTSRGALWKRGIELISEKPILGYGLDGVGDLYYSVGLLNDRPHNIVIQMSLFTGIPGMIMYMSFVLFVFIKNLLNVKKIDEIGIAVCFICGCYFISSMFGNTMFYTSPYYLIFLGFMMRNLYSKKEKLDI